MDVILSRGQPDCSVPSPISSSVSGSRVKSGSIRFEPRKTVFVRRVKKRVIWPRWNTSQALEFPVPQRHWSLRGPVYAIIDDRVEDASGSSMAP